jgi:hypothetical protein
MGTIPSEPPWVVEIEGVKFVTPELVCLLLQEVSEERDQLKEALWRSHCLQGGLDENEIEIDWDNETATLKKGKEK